MIFKSPYDRLVTWFNQKGYSGSPNEMALAYFRALMSTNTGTLNDIIYLKMKQLGYNGGLREMLNTFFTQKTGISNPVDAEYKFFLDSSLSFGSNPSYSNTGGTGNRTSLITVTTTFTMHNAVDAAGDMSLLVNGDTTENNLYNPGADATSAKYFRFDFGVGASKLITEAKWYQSGAQSQGTFKWQGSNDASAWTDIGSTFTLGGATVQTQTQLSGNATGYRYYQLLGTAGNLSSGPWDIEIEFKIDNA